MMDEGDDLHIESNESEEGSDELEAYDLEDEDNDPSESKAPLYLRDLLAGTLS